jgi:hypothetical protein
VRLALIKGAEHLVTTGPKTVCGMNSDQDVPETFSITVVNRKM